MSTQDSSVVLQTELPGLNLVRRGKVRDVYDLGEHFLIVATDRISAFDVVMPNGIPEKGKILTQLSVFWFDLLGVKNHLITADLKEMPENLHAFSDQLDGRSMLVEKLHILPVECIVRGYIAGSGWKDYKRSQSICGIQLPEGLQESEKFPEPLFTPTTKAEEGHDEAITFEEMIATEGVGQERAEALRDLSLDVYTRAADKARELGVILCDTKFEWGVNADGEIILADEVLTPDSSRYWDVNAYSPGKGQESYDKQYVRDYLGTLDWDKTPPGPTLPDEVVEGTASKYREIYQKLTGKAWGS